MPQAPFALTDASTAPTAASDLTYEEALHELEALVSQMESGQMPLDGLLSGYQRGIELLGTCRGKLAAVEQQIKRLDGQALQE
ncbi:MAG: exodeoxyribonuclease VII small subunit [Brachymonas sp.]|nr:exodeoxyribonuclease VII small subunit [Brachymonas sp.]NJS35260.1 exodeoxyribonuclease VII small subunit [Brachymonas sp.]